MEDSWGAFLESGSSLVAGSGRGQAGLPCVLLLTRGGGGGRCLDDSITAPGSGDSLGSHPGPEAFPTSQGPTHEFQQHWEVGVVIPLVLQIWKHDRGKRLSGQSCSEDAAEAGPPQVCGSWRRQGHTEIFTVRLQVVPRRRAAGQVSVLAQEVPEVTGTGSTWRLSLEDQGDLQFPLCLHCSPAEESLRRDGPSHSRLVMAPAGRVPEGVSACLQRRPWHDHGEG